MKLVNLDEPPLKENEKDALISGIRDCNRPANNDIYPMCGWGVCRAGFPVCWHRYTRKLLDTREIHQALG
jgi:hypothetical protein